MASVRQYASGYVLVYIDEYVRKYVSTYILPNISTPSGDPISRY